MTAEVIKRPAEDPAEIKTPTWIQVRLTIHWGERLWEQDTPHRLYLLRPMQRCSKNSLSSDHPAAAAKSLQLCLTLCDPKAGSPPGSPIPGILQARTLEWVTISFSNTWKWKVKNESEVIQSCPTLCDPMDCSLLDSSVHGVFQARVLEWVAIAFSTDHPRGSQREREGEKHQLHYLL